MSVVTKILRLAVIGGAFSFATLARAGDTSFAAPILSLEYGVICDYLPRGVEVPAPDTNAGMVRRGGGPISFDIASDIVPARIGVAFGIRLLMDEAAGTRTVVMVTRHPSFGPGFMETESWPSTLTGGAPSSRYFFFEFDYELAPGEWVMDVFLDDRLVAHKGFSVVDPATITGAPDPCPGPPQIS